MGIKINTSLALVSIILLSLFSTSISYAGNSPNAAHSSFTATEVPANGTQSTITITLRDSSGTPIAGDTVKLSNIKIGRASCRERV